MQPRFTIPTATRGRAPSHSPPDTRYAPGLRLARGLGWFSVALGLTELLAAKELAALTGVQHPALLRAYGLREISCGIGILASAKSPVGWLWARVAGDAIDLLTLGEVLTIGNGHSRKRSLLTAAAVGGVTVLDTLSALQLTAAQRMQG